MKLLVPFSTLSFDLMLESKGLVPEGYVRFLNQEEERQYLDQSPPSNTLLPRNPPEQSKNIGDQTPNPKTSWPAERELPMQESVATAAGTQGSVGSKTT